MTIVNDIVELDGSAGEGGGQILRSALTLSMATGTPFRITRVRANRKKPGLMRQHLTCVQAAAKACSAHVDEGFLGSTELIFRPGAMIPGEYHFAIGTAGSTTLVFQTLVPALIMTGKPFALSLEGGTHNTASPSLDFLDRVYLACLKRMGVDSSISLERRGFYPAGGGKWRVEIRPPQELKRLELLERGPFRSYHAKVLWNKIPEHVPQRELAYLKSKLGLDESQAGMEEAKDSPGPGNVILAEARYGNITEIVTGFGEFGVASEAVAQGVIDELEEYRKHDAPVGAHLADQLLLPMVLGPGGAFRTLPLTPHTRTNIETIRKFVARPIEVLKAADGTVEIRVS
jgi:RNA 3'-terminal phosphate cyclase (ATP)